LHRYFYDFEVYISPESDIPGTNLTGDNEKKLLLVLREGDLSEENKVFLTKVLSAVSYDLDRDASILVAPKDQAIAVNKMMQSGSYNNCIIFGIDPKEIGFSIEAVSYNPFTIADKKYLIGHSLEKIKTSTQLKKPLWKALQAIF